MSSISIIDVCRFVELEDAIAVLRQLVFYLIKSGFTPVDSQRVYVL